jgi:photosystem II stability/assembly factor-like uncharacterized protein
LGSAAHIRDDEAAAAAAVNRRRFRGIADRRIGKEREAMTISDVDVAAARGISTEQVQRLRKFRGLTNDALEKLPSARLLRTLRRLEYPDMPRARTYFRLLYARDSQGQIPRNGLADALRELRAGRAKMAPKPLVAGIPTGKSVVPRALALPPTAGLAAARWVALGPGNIGGRTRAIVVAPENPATMWAGSVGGGIWRTDDAGAHWAPADDFMANLAVTCIVMDPKQPRTLYAGTGEGFGNVDALRGAGIFRTTDGVTWSQLPGTRGADFFAVNRLAISKDGKTLLAATNSGIFRSVDANRATWTRVLGTAIADVKFHPTQATRAIAGGIDDGNAYYSTSGGSTWTKATHANLWSGRVEVTYAVKNPSIVYASVQMNGGEIWRSTDGGKTYTKRNAARADGTDADHLADQGWYGNVIWAGDPTNENFVVVGGIDLWKSTDGGNTLVDISTWWDPRSAHADHHAIVAHPAYDGVHNKTVFCGNDGGIYRADDVTTAGNDPDVPRVSGWTELDNTYGVTQFQGGAGNATTGTIIGGAQDNGTLCYKPAQGTEGWTTIFGGDGGWCASDPADPKIFYGEYVYLGIHRNTDGGASDDTDGNRYINGQFWNQVIRDWDWKPLPFRIPDAKTNRALFIAPFVLDPNNANRILAGGMSLWRTDDAKTPNTNTSGPSWSSIKASLASPISAIAVAKGNSDIVWVGYVDGSVYRTANGTTAAPVWQRVDGTGAHPLSAPRICTRIAIDPKNAQNVYVTFAGFDHGNVWRTQDGGANWRDLSGLMPVAPMRTVAIHPRKSALVYLGTEVGVFASEDGGTTWSPTNEGPTNCSVDELFWMGETLVCATHGRGMFKIDLSGV